MPSLWLVGQQQPKRLTALVCVTRRSELFNQIQCSSKERDKKPLVSHETSQFVDVGQQNKMFVRETELFNTNQ